MHIPAPAILLKGFITNIYAATYKWEEAGAGGWGSAAMSRILLFVYQFWSLKDSVALTFRWSIVLRMGLRSTVNSRDVIYIFIFWKFQTLSFDPPWTI